MVIKIVQHWDVPANGNDISEWYDSLDVKLKRRQDELRFEREVYIQLKSLQGKIIPEFYFACDLHWYFMSGFTTSYEREFLTDNSCLSEFQKDRLLII